MAQPRILVVEDNRIIAEDIMQSLQNMAYSVSSIVSSGEEALRKAEEDRPDLVMMDIVLEGEMDGIEAAARIKNSFNIPVVYLSAYSEKSMLERAKKTEPYGYLIKPFEDKELQATIEMALYKHRMESDNNRLKDFLQSILEGIGDGVVVVDRDYRIISANRGYCSQTRQSCADIIGRCCYEVSHHFTKPCFEMGEECSAKSAFETGSSQRVIHKHFDKDGNPVYIETISYPLKGGNGQVMSVIEVLADVTGKVKLENEVENRVRELEEFYEMAVGRELKMVKLKEEIEELRKRLGGYE